MTTLHVPTVIWPTGSLTSQATLLTPVATTTVSPTSGKINCFNV